MPTLQYNTRGYVVDSIRANKRRQQRIPTASRFRHLFDRPHHFPSRRRSMGRHLMPVFTDFRAWLAIPPVALCE